MSIWLPIILASTVDATANVAVVEGINDNVAETTNADGTTDRHASLFTGLDLGGRLLITERDTDTQTLSLRARFEAYEPFDRAAAQAPTLSLRGGYASSMTMSKRGSLTLAASASLSSVASTRTSDGTLLLSLDPTAQSTIGAVYSGSAAYSYALAPLWSLTETVSGVVTTTISAPPQQIANGVVLERTGLDGILPSETTTLSRELGPRDIGSISVRYAYTYSPYALDVDANPPRLGAPESIHQVVPYLSLAHTFSDRLSSTTSAGVSIATPGRFQENRDLIFFPVGSETITYTGLRWRARGLASVSYGTISPRLGSGPSFGASASIAGTPVRGRAFRDVYMIGAIQGNHSLIPTTVGDGTAPLEVFGATTELRYGLTKWLGLYTGYDFRFTSQIGTSVPSSFRQIFFLGLSGYFTTDGNLPPIETAASPYTPG